MGFNYFNYGTVQPCAIQNGKVLHRLPSGKIIEYPCALDVDIPEQTNFFYGETIAFWLKHNGLSYYGRFDGSITIIRDSDGLLVGLNHWEAPKRPTVQHCGIYLEHGLQQSIYVDLRDRQSLYTYGQPISSALLNPCNEEFDTLSSTVSSLIEGVISGHIYTKGGEALGTKVWNIQKSIRGRNCRIFL